MWPFQAVFILYALKLLAFCHVGLFLRKTRSGRTSRAKKRLPSVDILLPMYNEEKVVDKTIRNLLAIRYENYSIIVIDDGSTDRSYDLVRTQFGGEPRVKLLRQENAGKSMALNRGMIASESEIIVTIDADTWVRPDAIEKIVAYFDREDVAAVAGHIKVGNRVNLLTEMQYYEYIAIWDNDRRLSAPINGILVVPGALAAYRRSMVEAVGSFKQEVIAEDTELTLRLLNGNYILRNAHDAVAYTEAPDNLRMFFRQRVRWTTGLTQGLLKHNRRLFTHGNHWLRFLVLPLTWAFRVILPLFLPLVDYYFLIAYFVLGDHNALLWWAGLVLTEAAVNLYILSTFGERVNFFKLLIIQRLYRHLLFFNYGFIFSRWLNGSLFNWSKITRKGTISLEGEIPVVQEQKPSKQTQPL